MLSSIVASRALCALMVLAAPSPDDLGRAQFETGSRHYELGEYREALAAFKHAYHLTAHPRLLFNVGQCQRKLGDVAAAIDAYQAYLRAVPHAENRAQVEQLITRLESQRAPPPAERDKPEPAPAADVAVAPRTAVPAAAPPVVTARPVDRAGQRVAVPVAALSSGPEPRAWYARPWAWTGAAVVLGAAVAAAVLLTRSSGSTDPECESGRLCP